MRVSTHETHQNLATKPAVTLGDIFRGHGAAYRQTHGVSPQQSKAMIAIEQCRTSALGGHLYTCDRCYHSLPLYNSCRNRHCPQCQSLAQGQWIAQRMERILPITYFHVVFTLPAELRSLAQANPREVYSLLFSAASQTLLELGHDPKRLGAQLGITAILHTWTRKLEYHPHLHCIVTNGGLNTDDQRWLGCAARGNYLFPVKVMASLFRGKFLAGLESLIRANKLLGPFAKAETWAKLKNLVYGKKWQVYAKRPFAGAKNLFQYLGRYTHRVGISNQRLISANDKTVCFATKNGGKLSLPVHEFIKRFLQHLLPPRFTKIRHFGLFAARNVHGRLAQARSLLTDQDQEAAINELLASVSELTKELDSLKSDNQRPCPVCKIGHLIQNVPLSRERHGLPEPEP